MPLLRSHGSLLCFCRGEVAVIEMRWPTFSVHQGGGCGKGKKRGLSLTHQSVTASGVTRGCPGASSLFRSELGPGDLLAL